MLSPKQKKFLRSQAHSLKPVVWVGQHGLTDNVLAEIEIALDHHELIKVKISLGDRDLREQAISNVCDKTQAENVQRIGNIAVLYRRNPDTPLIKLPA